MIPGVQKDSDENKKTVTMTSRTTRGRKIPVKLLSSSKGEDEVLSPISNK